MNRKSLSDTRSKGAFWLKWLGRILAEGWPGYQASPGGWGGIMRVIKYGGWGSWVGILAQPTCQDSCYNWVTQDRQDTRKDTECSVLEKPNWSFIGERVCQFPCLCPNPIISISKLSLDLLCGFAIPTSPRTKQCETVQVSLIPKLLPSRPKAGEIVPSLSGP